jgi:hypothetical protein
VAILSSDLTEKLIEAKIPTSEYVKAMDLVEDYEEFDPTGDPVEDFKEAIRILNEDEGLPSWMSSWCRMYGYDYKPMEIEPMEPEVEI